MNSKGIPHAFVVGKDGKVSWHDHPMSRDFEPAIEKALAVPSTAPAAPAPSFDPSKMSTEEISKLSAKDLKGYLKAKKIDVDNVLEKSELVDLVLKSAKS